MDAAVSENNLLGKNPSADTGSSMASISLTEK